MNTKKTSIYYAVIGVALLLVGGFAIRDICVYVNGGRPCSATVDGLCDVFFRPKRNNLVAKIPLDRGDVQLTVSHKWRGCYQFKLWCPDETPDEVSVTEQIGLDCSFFDGEGNEIYVNRTPPSSYSSWNKRRRNLLGSEMSFRMYLVPQHVPLDTELTVKANFYGQFDRFYTAHSNACLILVKEKDK